MEQAEQHLTEDHGGVQMLVYDSVDEDTCPAECVTEIFTASEFKKICQVLVAGPMTPLLGETRSTLQLHLCPAKSVQVAGGIRCTGCGGFL